MKTSYSIGEFSQVTGLSPKTLRFYHEKGLLTPTSVDEATGYRFYDADKVDKARVIMRLRQMEFSIEDIAAVFRECDDDANILTQLERQKQFLQQRIAEDRDILRSIGKILTMENEAKALLQAGAFQVKEKSLEPTLVAGIRMKGKYSDVGEGFARLGKTIGRHISGKPLCFYYDGEYREDDANFEPCFPVRKEVIAEGISTRKLPAVRALSLVHRGPYDQLGRSYAKILNAISHQKMRALLPTREVYVKGPGMIFKGNSKNYLTEIQLPIES